MGYTKEKRLINAIAGKPTIQKRTPVATDMFLPNHSGDHSAGLVNSTPTNDTDLVNKKYVDDNDIIDDGTAAGQMCFWNGTSWTPTETSELYWDDTNKRVGVGTDSPDDKLHLLDTVLDTNLKIETNRVNGQAKIIYQNDARDWRTGINTVDSFQIRDETGGANVMLLASGSNANSIRVDSDGVGILNSNPQYPFHVKGKTFINSNGDANGLIVETGNVGIGTTTPDTKLQVVGDTKFGQDTTNYAGFKGDGELELVGTARVIKCITIRVGGFKAPGANPADLEDLGIAQCYAFDPTTQEYICTEITLPTDMDLSVAPYFIADWSAAATTGTAVWQLEYLYRAEDEDMTAAAQATIRGEATPSATSNGLVRETLTGIAVPSSTDRGILVRISRDTSDATYTDDMAGDAHLTALKFCYTANKLGTAL